AAQARAGTLDPWAQRRIVDPQLAFGPGDVASDQQGKDQAAQDPASSATGPVAAPLAGELRQRRTSFVRARPVIGIEMQGALSAAIGPENRETQLRRGGLLAVAIQLSDRLGRQLFAEGRQGIEYGIAMRTTDAPARCGQLGAAQLEYGQALGALRVHAGILRCVRRADVRRCAPSRREG